MIAKKVHEALNFERGKAPLDSMEIGYLGGYKDWDQSDLKNAYRDLLERSKGKPFRNKGMAEELTKAKPNRLWRMAGWGNMDRIIDEMNEEEFDRLREVVVKYLKMCLELS